MATESGLLYRDPILFTSGQPLTSGTHHFVAEFTCARPGQEESRFERDVSQWARDTGRGGALEAARLGLSDVRLFFHDGELLGYAAIGEEVWPLADGEHLNLWVLQFLGIHTRWRYQNVPKPDRFGRRLLGGMWEEIVRRGKHELAGLYVDPDNEAIALYTELKFSHLDPKGHPWCDPDDNGRPWIRMVRRLV